MIKLVEIANQLVTKIKDSISDARLLNSEEVNATVKRVWDLEYQTPEQCAEINDRRVFVLPIDKEFREAADRENDRNVYRFGIVIADRIPGELIAEEYTSEMTVWIDQAVDWVDRLVISALSDINYSPIPNAYLETLDWREVIKRGIFRRFGIFWSEIDIEFFIDEAN